MKQYNALFSQESVALYQLSPTNPNKIDQHLANLLPLLSFPYLRNYKRINPYFLGISTFQNCAMLMGNPMGVLLHAGSLIIMQLIFNIPLTSVSTVSPLELTCMQILIVNHQLHDKSLHVN